MAYSSVPSCFHGYLLHRCSFSTTQFFSGSLSCGFSASTNSRLRTCVKFEKFQGDSPLEQNTSVSSSSSVSQELPLEEAQDQLEEEEDDDEFSNFVRLFSLLFDYTLFSVNWVFIVKEEPLNSIQS
jgi:hypothetical protein